MSFESLGLKAELVRAVNDHGYTVPTPIQTQAIPVILAGRDVLAAAQTGTGKTAGFVLPLLQRLTAAEHTRAARGVRALILTPTRELAAQVGESVRTYGKHLPLTSAIVFGGVGMKPQVDALKPGVDVLVATPGRLLDHVGQRTIDLSKVEILVLDEADRMLDMGFIHDIRRVLKLLPAGRQNLLFSATFSDEIRTLAGGLLSEPVSVEVARRNTAAESVSQVVHRVDRERKRELLSHLITSNGWDQVLVFTRTKHGANRLAQQLERDGITAAAIHGNKSQSARTRALADFKASQVRVLVATDIAARGIDIDELPHVVNYELPQVPEDYVHRIGRTGRAGSSGAALSLVENEERKQLIAIERLLNRTLPVVEVPGFEPGTPSTRPVEREAERPRGDQPRRARQGQPQGQPHNRGGRGDQARGGQRGEPRQGQGAAGRGAQNANGGQGRDAQGNGGQRRGAQGNGGQGRSGQGAGGQGRGAQGAPGQARAGRGGGQGRGAPRGADAGRGGAPGGQGRMRGSQAPRAAHQGGARPGRDRQSVPALLGPGVDEDSYGNS